MADRLGIDVSPYVSINDELRKQDVLLDQLMTRYGHLSSIGKTMARAAHDRVTLEERQIKIQESIASKTKYLLELEQMRVAAAGMGRAFINAINAAERDQIRLLQTEYDLRDQINAQLRRQAGNLALMKKSGMQGLIDAITNFNVLWDASLGEKGGAAGIYIVKKTWETFKQLDSAAADFRRNVGATRLATDAIEATSRKVALHYAGIGVSAKNVYDSNIAIAEVVGNWQTATEGTVEAMAILAAQAGVVESTSAAFLKTMAMVGKSTLDAQKDMLFFTQHMAEAGNVPLNKVMEDVAAASKNSYQFMSRSPLALAKAAVEAKKMGTSLTSAATSADKLVDFTNSVTAEMEASVLFGESINLQRARELAYRKDLRGLNQEILRIAQQTNFEDLDPFQQKAVAAALGKSAEEVAKILQSEKERQSYLKDPALANQRRDYEKMVAANESISKSMAASGKAQLTIRSNQAAITSVTLAWNSILQNIGSVYLPVIAKVLGWVATALNGISKWMSEWGDTTKWVVSGVIALGTAWYAVSKIIRVASLATTAMAAAGAGAGAAGGALGGLAAGLSAMGAPLVRAGAFNMIIFTAALIPFAFAMKMMADVPWPVILAGSVAILALAGAAALLSGASLPMVIGAAALLVLGIAMISFAAAAWIASKALQNITSIKWDNLISGIENFPKTKFVLLAAALGAGAGGLAAFSLAAIPFAAAASLAGVGLMSMASGLNSSVEAIERLSKVNLSQTISQVGALAIAVGQLSSALNSMPDIQVDKIERLQLKGAAAGEAPTVVKPDSSMLDEMKAMREELCRMNSNLLSGKLVASVSMDGQKLDNATGRSLEFRGKLV